MSRWPEPNTNATEADTTHTLSPSYSSSLFVGSPSTPFLKAQAEPEQEPCISPLTTPRQRRTSPRKPNTPISRTTPVGSIQKPTSSDHLTKNFSILSLNRSRTTTPNSSPTRRPDYTLRNMWAMEQFGLIDENDPSSGTLTAQDSVAGSSSSSPEAEYTSDSESTLSSPQDTSLMSLDQHLCCWKTGDDEFNPVRCGWESLSHEDLWQHVMCEHFNFIEVFQGKSICGWVCEAEGRDVRAVCGVGIESLEEMREHVIEHVRNEGGRAGGGEDSGWV